MSIPVIEFIECPKDRLSRGVIKEIRIEFEKGDDYVYTKLNIKEEEFPLAVEVPFNWGETETTMKIYVNDIRNVYEMRIVKRTEEQMIATPTPAEWALIETPTPEEENTLEPAQNN